MQYTDINDDGWLPRTRQAKRNTLNYAVFLIFRCSVSAFGASNINLFVEKKEERDEEEEDAELKPKRKDAVLLSTDCTHTYRRIHTLAVHVFLHLLVIVARPFAAHLFWCT